MKLTYNSKTRIKQKISQLQEDNSKRQMTGFSDKEWSVYMEMIAKRSTYSKNSIQKLSWQQTLGIWIRENMDPKQELSLNEWFMILTIHNEETALKRLLQLA